MARWMVLFCAETPIISEPRQAIGVFGRLEDRPAIGALALEHGARIVQAVAEHMQIGVSPRHQLAVVPDDPFEPVIGLCSHDFLLRLANFCFAHDLFRKPVATPDQVRGRLFRDHAAGPAGLFGRRLMPRSWSIFSVYSNTLRLGTTPGMNGAGPVLSPSRWRTAGKKGRFGTILSSLDTFL